MLVKNFKNINWFQVIIISILIVFGMFFSIRTYNQNKKLTTVNQQIQNEMELTKQQNEDLDKQIEDKVNKRMEELKQSEEYKNNK